MTTRNTRVRGDAVAPIEGVTVEGSDYSPGTGTTCYCTVRNWTMLPGLYRPQLCLE